MKKMIHLLDAMRSRGITRKSAVLLVGVSSALTLGIGSATPAQASDYRRENSTTFTVKFGTSGSTCNGWAWIGQTWNGSIEASTSVSCPGQQAGLLARARIATSTVGGILKTHSVNCELTSYCIASTSISGSNGKTYCNQGYAATIGFSQKQGYGNVCIKT